MQEESRIQGRNGPIKEENVALAAKTKKGKKFAPQKKGWKFKGPSDKSRIICYNCQKPGHYARDCRKPRGRFKRKRFHVSAVDTEKELANKRQKESTNEQEERPKYYLILALFESITGSTEIWLVDGGASRHMMGYKNALSNLKEKKFSV